MEIGTPCNYDLAGQSGIARRGENWDFSPVELVIPLTIAGVATPTGIKTGSALQTVALGSVETPLVVAMVASMWSLTLVMMIQ